MPQQQITFADLAIGLIGPDVLIAESKVDAAQAQELAERLHNGEFYVPVDDEHRPNAPGGTFALVIADALTARRFVSPGDNAADHAKKLFSFLQTIGDEAHRKIIPATCIDGRFGKRRSQNIVGGHDGEHGEDDCGAQKRLAEILGYIANRGDEIREYLTSLGVETDDAAHNLITSNASELAGSGYASDGITIRRAYVEVAGEDSVVRLQGNHGEIEAELNMDSSKTLDREKIATEYGENLGVFNADIGVYAAAAQVVSITEEEARQKEHALYYYTVATSAVLGHASLPVSVREVANSLQNSI